MAVPGGSSQADTGDRSWPGRLLDRVRSELSGLTTRGRSFISAGLASALCALILGQADLLRVALLLIALPFGCLMVLARSRYRIGLARAISPDRVPAGSPLRVRLELKNLSRATGQVLLAEDQTPPALGPPTRFVLDRLPSGRKMTVTYSLRASVRGRYPVGPMRLRVSDPFGMCETSRSFTAVSTVTVVPQHWPLEAGDGGGTWGGSGDSLARAAAVHGEDDIATREYREGDELRRIHWRSTAKRDQLMVRREEQPRQLRATVLLDSRQDAHRGEGWASSYEWAVKMAASVAVHLSGRQYGVRLLLDGQHAGTWTRPQTMDDAAGLLDQLAVAHLRPDPVSFEDALGVLRRSGGDGLVVAVLGSIGAEQVEDLARMARRGVSCVAVLLRTAEWESRLVRGAKAPQTDRERWETDRSAAALREAGWMVAEAGPDSSGTDVWAEATASRGETGGGWGGRGQAGPTVGGRTLGDVKGGR